jgi:hypothetical protein
VLVKAGNHRRKRMSCPQSRHGEDEREAEDGIEIGELRLVCTCGACPEQYDVFHGDKLVGYMRLRHGVFTVEAGDACGELVFRGSPRGDGMFRDDERERWLKHGAYAIKIYMKYGTIKVEGEDE